ncbi:MAG: TetR/AcrR family transcriptional regulator [Devosia sp.]|nr:TetR/AcrR family transcriptional regulator [Devosia sp.]
MCASVNVKRRYRSSRREAQAAETRQAVLAAARTVFISSGWQKATIAAIARLAGVSTETIYATFGSKRAVLEALVTQAVRGAAPDVPLAEQAGPRAVREAPDQRQQLQLFVEDITRVLARAAPVMAVVRAAAEAEPELASLYATLHRGRARNLEMVIDAMLRHGPLRRGLDPRHALATLARVTSPELFLLATGVEGSSPADYQDWLLATLTMLLIE